MQNYLCNWQATLTDNELWNEVIDSPWAHYKLETLYNVRSKYIADIGVERSAETHFIKTVNIYIKQREELNLEDVLVIAGYARD